MLDLFENQPWVAEKESALIELISECDSSEKELLIFDLLNRFFYLKSEDYSYQVQIYGDPYYERMEAERG